LLVDLDAQASLTVSLGYQQPDQLDYTITTAMAATIEEKEVLLQEMILPHSEGIDLLPSNIELSTMEVILVNTMGRETILRECLKPVQPQYDYILLDCMSSLGMLTINALATADEALIPIQAQYLSLKGLEQLLRTIFRIRRRINPSLSIAGLLLTMVDRRTNYTRDIIELLHATYDGKLPIFQSVIPRSVRAAEISAEGKSIYLHDPKGKVAQAYAELTKEVIAVEK